MFYSTLDIDKAGLEKPMWENPMSDQLFVQKRAFSLILYSSKSLQSVLFTMKLADSSMINVGLIVHTNMLSNYNDSVGSIDWQIRQIIDTSYCLKTAGAAFVILLQVNKYKNKTRYESSPLSLVNSIQSLEEQMRGSIDLLVVHDATVTMNNTIDMNNEIQSRLALSKITNKKDNSEDDGMVT